MFTKFNCRSPIWNNILPLLGFSAISIFTAVSHGTIVTYIFPQQGIFCSRPDYTKVLNFLNHRSKCGSCALSLTHHRLLGNNTNTNHHYDLWKYMKMYFGLFKLPFNKLGTEFSSSSWQGTVYFTWFNICIMSWFQIPVAHNQCDTCSHLEVWDLWVQFLKSSFNPKSLEFYEFNLQN